MTDNQNQRAPLRWAFPWRVTIPATYVRTYARNVSRLDRLAARGRLHTGERVVPHFVIADGGKNAAWETSGAHPPLGSSGFYS
jgi:hypothetical protein